MLFGKYPKKEYKKSILFFAFAMKKKTPPKLVQYIFDVINENGKKWNLNAMKSLIERTAFFVYTIPVFHIDRLF